MEIFFHHEEEKLKAIENGSVKCFSEVSKQKLDFLYQIIDSEPETKATLNKMYPNNKDLQIRKLAKCRFGGLNFLPDFCGLSKNYSSDYISCPFRDTCIGNNVVCRKITYNNEEITDTDVKAINLIANTDYKTEVLAEELNMPLGTFHVYRTNLFKKLNIKSKPELARVGVELGLI